MNGLGGLCLILVAVLCVAGLLLAAVAAVTRRRELMRGVLGAVYVVAALTVIASIVLLVALVTRDFSYQYVYENSSRALPMAYTVSAFWAGNAGSLLFWLLVLTVFSVVVLRRMRSEDAPSVPYTAAILLGISAFFSLLMLFGNASNPFVRPAGNLAPPDGLGLNPLLENPGMVIHPAALFLGYVGFAFPFAVAMGGLLARSPSAAWLPALRRWTLVGWFFLTIGNMVGAWWAYVTLGWGGYWAWDPVENASLMPWLTGTALVHSVVMLRKRQMLSAWTIGLVVVSFLLTIFGTFLTRSGVATSVHAFSDNTFIPWFTVFMLLIIGFSVIVIFARRGDVRSAKRLEEPVSRESTFLYTNLLLAVLTFVVLWGVVFPIVAGAIRGVQVELDPNFYSSVAVPLGLVLLILTGLCPLLPWRGRDRTRVVNDLAWTGGIAVAVLVVLVALGLRRAYPLLGFTFAAFAASSMVLQYGRGWRNRRNACRTGWLRSFGGMVWTNRSRYGGFLVHLGVIIVLVGVNGSYSFKQVFDGELFKGGSIEAGRFVLTYEGFTTEVLAEKQRAQATLTVSHDGRVVGEVRPVREYYPARDQVWTRVDRHSTLAGDVYVSLLGYTQDGSGITVEVEINPLVNWLWIGGGVMVVGGLIAMWPVRRRNARGRGPAAKVGRRPPSKSGPEDRGAAE